MTTQYADLWVNTILPDKNLADVSDQFPGVVGCTITNITFDHRSIQKGNTHYGQPIVFLEMDSGRKVRFSINFGEVEEKDRAAFFSIQ